MKNFSNCNEHLLMAPTKCEFQSFQFFLHSHFDPIYESFVELKEARKEKTFLIFSFLHFFREFNAEGLC